MCCKIATRHIDSLSGGPRTACVSPHTFRNTFMKETCTAADPCEIRTDGRCLSGKVRVEDNSSSYTVVVTRFCSIFVASLYLAPAPGDNVGELLHTTSRRRQGTKTCVAPAIARSDWDGAMARDLERVDGGLPCSSNSRSKRENVLYYTMFALNGAN